MSHNSSHVPINGVGMLHKSSCNYNHHSWVPNVLESCPAQQVSALLTTLLARRQACRHVTPLFATHLLHLAGWLCRHVHGMAKLSCFRCPHGLLPAGVLFDLEQNMSGCVTFILFLGCILPPFFSRFSGFQLPSAYFLRRMP